MLLPIKKGCLFSGQPFFLHFSYKRYFQNYYCTLYLTNVFTLPGIIVLKNPDKPIVALSVFEYVNPILILKI